MSEAAGHATRPLSRREQAVLDFERNWPEHEGRKEQAIRQRFGISQARYYQLLNRTIDLRAASDYDPLLVLRLRRRRDERKRRQATHPLRQPRP
jgi:hypothetical protein